jgi:hypothetical protein
MDKNNKNRERFKKSSKKMDGQLNRKNRWIKE